MPLVHISLRAGKSPAYRKAISDGVYEAMLATINVPRTTTSRSSPSSRPTACLRPRLPRHPPHGRRRLHRGHPEPGPEPRDEESLLRPDRREPREEPGPPEGRRPRQPRRGAEGELVVRKRPRVVRVSQSSEAPNRAFARANTPITRPAQAGQNGLNVRLGTSADDRGRFRGNLRTKQSNIEHDVLLGNGSSRMPNGELVTSDFFQRWAIYTDRRGHTFDPLLKRIF